MDSSIESRENMPDSDPWAQAFEALNQIGKEDAEADPDTADGAGEQGGPADDDGAQQVIPDNDEGGDGDDGQGIVGEPDNDDGDGNREIDDNARNPFHVRDEDPEVFRKEVEENARTQAINDIAQEFIKRGIRNSNGRLGASLDDPDICKRDDDGVPHFYNPETGREFTGDNPRRQAQEWIEDYNNELARVFNSACEKYEKHLLEQSMPAIAVMEFAPKYNKLDPIRKGMFEDVIKDYEIEDESGKLIGYSCDLDKALALVDRQIATIQSYAKANSQKQQQQQPTGPALDMKTSSGAVQVSNNDAPKSLAEAMERIQDAQLEKLNK